MRVLFFIAEYHRFSGAQISLLHLISHLPAAGIEFTVLFPGEGLCVERYRAAGIPVEVLPAPSALHQFGASAMNKSLANQVFTFGPSVMRYSLAIAKLMRRGRIDILHCNTLRAVLIGALWPRLLGYPVIWHGRGLLPVSMRLVALGGRLSSRIILVANALRDELDASAKRKCLTIYDAVHIDGVDHLKANNGGDDDLRMMSDGVSVIVTMSSIALFKGLHHLVEAARLINSNVNIPKPLFLVLGVTFDQEYHQYLRQLIDRYQLDNFHFLGWKQNPFPYYRRAQIVVLPTVRSDQLEMNGVNKHILGGEGLPFSILEAMAVGKPVVATDVAGIPEQIIEGQTGFVVPQCDPDSLANAITKLLADPERAKQMGFNARVHVEENFSCELMVGKTKRLYKELAG